MSLTEVQTLCLVGVIVQTVCLVGVIVQTLCLVGVIAKLGSQRHGQQHLDDSLAGRQRFVYEDKS